MDRTLHLLLIFVTVLLWIAVLAAYWWESRVRDAKGRQHQTASPDRPPPAERVEDRLTGAPQGSGVMSHDPADA